MCEMWLCTCVPAVEEQCVSVSGRWCVKCDCVRVCRQLKNSVSQCQVDDVWNVTVYVCAGSWEQCVSVSGRRWVKCDCVHVCRQLKNNVSQCQVDDVWNVTVRVCRQLKNYCHRQCCCIYFFLSGYGNCNAVFEDIFCMNTYIYICLLYVIYVLVTRSI